MHLIPQKIWTYPFLGGAGIEVPSALVVNRGLQHDSLFAAVRERDDQCLRAWDHSGLRAIRPEIQEGGENRLVLHLPTGKKVELPTYPSGTTTVVSLGRESVRALRQPPAASACLSDHLAEEVFIVRVDPYDERTIQGARVGFQEEGQVTAISVEALAALNERIQALGEYPLPAEIFQANLLLEGALPPADIDCLSDISDPGGHVRMKGLDLCRWQGPPDGLVARALGDRILEGVPRFGRAFNADPLCVGKTIRVGERICTYGLSATPSFDSSVAA